MSTHKLIDRICLIVISVALVITVLFMNGEALGLTAVASELVSYESHLFDTSYVHTINIVMDDWEGFLEDCESEEYTLCTVVIDGKSYTDVAIRAKGNTSLSNVSSLGSQRYSFKVEFDHYDSSQTYYGLDKLCLNNCIQDNTYMKDYLVYRMMDEYGVDAPLCSYSYLTVNGEDWGLYLSVEGIEDGFLERVYEDEGNLYKPDSMSFGGGRGNGKDFDMDAFMEENWDTDASEEESRAASSDSSGTSDESSDSASDSEKTVPAGGFGGGNMPQMPMQGGSDSDTATDGETSSAMPQMPQMNGDFDFSDFDPSELEGFDPSSIEGLEDFDFSSFDPTQMGGGGGMGFGGMGSDDVKLKYIDDNISSYSNIFSSAKTDITTEDETRLIESLKSLSSYEDLEEVLDMDKVLRYFVVHTFVCNGDSYTGSMIHNYYLYENNGQLAMIPWDYNLAFGTFQGGNASSEVNDPIDDPVSGDADDRPMIGWIFSSEEYTNSYHEYYESFISQFIDSGWLQNEIDTTAALIAPYVEKDPTAFCTYEEFETGVETLKTFCDLRGQSVSGQLSGTIPSTEAGQSADSSALIDTGDLNLSDMGSMGNTMGGGFGGNHRSERSKGTDSTAGDTAKTAIDETANEAETPTAPAEDSSDAANAADSTAPTLPSGEAADGNTPPDMPEGENAASTIPGGMIPGNGAGSATAGEDATAMPSDDGATPQMPGNEQGGMTQMPGNGQGDMTPPDSGNTEDTMTPPSAGTTEDTDGNTPPEMPSNAAAGGETTDSGHSFPEAKGDFAPDNATGSGTGSNTWLTLLLCAVVLIGGLTFAILYQRRTK